MKKKEKGNFGAEVGYLQQKASMGFNVQLLGLEVLGPHIQMKSLTLHLHA